MMKNNVKGKISEISTTEIFNKLTKKSTILFNDILNFILMIDSIFINVQHLNVMNFITRSPLISYASKKRFYMCK